MLAPHNVTSTLRMMSDAQLAQYAQMHQNDPYIFPLAFQESQDRKNMRAQQMAKQTGQAQPPVNQQDLAQMMPQRPIPQAMPQGAPQAPQQAAPQLPEEQGIGALPAENLQKMAGGGITGEHHFDKGGSAYGYTPLTQADLPTNPTAEEINQYTGTLRAGAEAAAAPEQAKTAQLFDPYIQKLKSKQADIENRKDTNTQMALLQAGLGMLGGTSPYAFQNIAAGGKEGVAAYVSGKKAIEDSQDALDHSQFLAEQAKSAALKGDVKDQIALQNAAQSSMMAGKHLQLAGITTLNTSQAKAGELAAKKEENEIKASDVAGKKDYYASEAELNRAKIPSQSDKSNALLDSKINSATLPFKKKISDLLGKPYVNEKAINNLIDEHNAAVDAVYAGHPEAVNKYGHLPKFVAPKDDTEGNESSFWDIFKSKSSTPDNSAAAAAPTAVTPTIAPNPTIGLPAGVPGATTRDGPLPPGMNPNNPKGVKFLGFEQ